MTTFGILFFLLLGGLTFFAFARIMSFTKPRKTEKRFLMMLYLSVLHIGFGLAWAYTSFLENEPYAAYLGLMVFCGLGLVLGAIGLWKVMDFETAGADQESGGSKLEISWQKGLAIVLLVVFTMTFPVTCLFKSTTAIVSDKEQVSTYLYESLLSDRALPDLIRKAMAYEAWLTPMEEPLESRIIKSVVSGIDPLNWIELFDYIAPGKERKALLDQVTSSIYSWIAGDDLYPSLTLQTGVYLKNIEFNAENLMLWIFKSFPIPACNPDQILDLERGTHDNDLKKLIFCRPPESLQMKLVPVGAALIKEQLAQKNPPPSVNVTEKIKHQNSADKLSVNKQKIRTLFFLGSTLWILPVVLLLIGLMLAARSLKSVVAWASWPLTIAGLSGLIIASRLPGLSYLHKIPKELPEQLPPHALAIIQELGIDLAVLVENAMFTPFLIMVGVGGILLVFTLRTKMSRLVSKTRLSARMLVGKQTPFLERTENE